MKHIKITTRVNVVACLLGLLISAAASADNLERTVKDLQEQVEKLQLEVKDLKMLARVHLGAIQRLNGQVVAKPHRTTSEAAHD